MVVKQMLSTDTPVVQKMCELYKMFHEHLKLFPKNDKYDIGAKCENTLLNALEYLIKASNANIDKKLPYLQQASTEFDILKIFFRMANEIHALDDKKYLALQGHIQEIGKMIGGWQRSLC
ncbi:MAG: diversity-generating retroelement protein Avd [Parcubacteria group bacterium]